MNRPQDLAESETTEDAVLGGRLRLRQPARGHRVGHDAILLAAAVAARPHEHAVELGAGVGAAGLAVARRIPGLWVTLTDIDPALVALAADNAARNGLADRVTAAVFDAAGPARSLPTTILAPGCAQHVLMNPPFNDPGASQASPDPARAHAHTATRGTLTSWIATAARLLADGGTVTLIWRADGLADVLRTLTGFGGIAILPVHPRPDAPAIRILVRATSGSLAPLQMLPGLVLNDAHGRPSAAAEAILREAAPLPLAVRF
jgi:tRNA1(Val) A37 N6-methylase TrmN6